jgi:hypothetical protein
MAVEIHLPRTSEEALGLERRNRHVEATHRDAASVGCDEAGRSLMVVVSPEPSKAKIAPGVTVSSSTANETSVN